MRRWIPAKIRACGKRCKLWAMEHSLGLTLALFAFLFLVVFFWQRIFISVYPGEAAVVWRRFGGGTSETELYLEGLHIFPPWDKVYKYNIRKQGRALPQKVLCSNGLEIDVQAAVRFRPHRHKLPIIHKWYGPNYVEVLIVPEVRAAIQEIIGQYQPEQVYALRRSHLEWRMFQVAARAIGRDDIELLDLTVTSIHLPPRIQNAVQDKLVEEQAVQLFDFRLQKERKEALRKKIEADGVAVFNTTIRPTLSSETLHWKGIEATQELAKSSNAKVVIMSGKTGLPLILGGLEAK